MADLDDPTAQLPRRPQRVDQLQVVIGQQRAGGGAEQPAKRSAEADPGLHGTDGTAMRRPAGLEQLQQEGQLLGGVPGQVMVLGVAHRQLGILVP